MEGALIKGEPKDAKGFLGSPGEKARWSRCGEGRAWRPARSRSRRPGHQPRGGCLRRAHMPAHVQHGRACPSRGASLHSCPALGQPGPAHWPQSIHVGNGETRANLLPVN